MKKMSKIFLIFIGTILIVALTAFAIDYMRVSQQREPIFCYLKNEVNDGKTQILVLDIR